MQVRIGNPHNSASLAVLLLGVLPTLPPVAHASPTDTTWIPGFYDDNDYDDVILFITGAVSTVDSGIVDPVGPRLASGRPLESLSPRAPPSPLA